MCSLRLVAAVMVAMPSIIIAQSADQFTLWGDNALRLGDNYGASRFFHEALQKEPGALELQLKYADACRLSNQYPQAAEFYDKVQRKDLRHAHPEVLRWLGEMQMSSGNYADAEKTWTKVKQHAKDTTSFDAKRARNALLGCALAKKLMQTPDSVGIEHLPEPVNSYDSEFGARPDPGSEAGAVATLYFSALLGGTNSDGEVQDTGTYHVGVYTAQQQGEAWTKPALLEGGVNLPTGLAAAHDDNANSAWSPDHKWFYFTRCDAEHHCAIYVCSWVDGKLGEAQFLPGISEEGNTTQPMLVDSDGQTKLFYSSDRPGGQGGMDIWMCAINGTRILPRTPWHRPSTRPATRPVPSMMR